MTTESSPEAQVEALSACPLCGGVRFKKLATPGHWIGPETFGPLRPWLGLVACRDCGLAFANPRPAPQALDAFYSGTTYVCHEAEGSASAGAKAQFVLDRLERFLPAEAPRALLDYGAGGGGFLRHARDQGWEVQGFEPGQRGLAACRAAGLDVTDRLEDLPEKRFGLVCLHHVLEHLASPIEALRSIRRWTAPQGRLFVEVPNKGSLRARVSAPALSRGLGLDERHRAFPIHLMYYDRSTLSRTLNEAGWDVEAVFTLGLGIDKLIAGPERPPGAPPAPARPPAAPGGGRPAPPRRRWRHAARDAFLNLGLGENLAVVARSKSPGPTDRMGAQ